MSSAQVVSASESPVQLAVYLRGADNGVLYSGDPVRIAVVVTPAAGTLEPVRLSAPPGAPWTAGLRVRLHREDGKAIGQPAWPGSPRVESEIDISAAHPAGGIWCWSASVTEALPPGIYRVSARLVPPAGAAEKAGAASPVAETLFTLAPAPEVMTPAQRTRWHFELAMVAFHAGDRVRAKRLVEAVLTGQPEHGGARQLQRGAQAAHHGIRLPPIGLWKCFEIHDGVQQLGVRCQRPPRGGHDLHHAGVGQGLRQHLLANEAGGTEDEQPPHAPPGQCDTASLWWPSGLGARVWLCKAIANKERMNKILNNRQGLILPRQSALCCR